MPPRRTRRLSLRNSPLVMVLCEVQFAPVLLMNSRVPSIQEHLRGHGFPTFQRQVTHEIQFGPEENPKITTSPRWVFGDQERTHYIVLTDSSVAYETSYYHSFERFTEQLETALEVLSKEVAPAFSERIGLRYVNAIRPNGDRDVEHYLRPSMRGLNPESVGADSLLWRVETSGTVPVGEIRVRLFQENSGSILPPDILAPELLLAVDLEEEGYTRTILDIDCAATAQLDFDSEVLLNKLWELHEYNDRAFRAAVTDSALEEWGEEVHEYGAENEQTSRVADQK